VSQTDFEVRSTWDGRPLETGEWARISLDIDRANDRLLLKVDAAFHDDPAPESPPTCFDGLWDFEVVELFLVGSDERYLEVELGPHGHHLGLRLTGRRRVVEWGIPIDFEAVRAGSHWQGEARISLAWLPTPIHSVNVYAIHGRGSARRYLAMHPVPGSEPDFHRLEHFAPFRID
jgi:hypothetical protein